MTEVPELMKPWTQVGTPDIEDSARTLPGAGRDGGSESSELKESDRWR